MQRMTAVIAGAGGGAVAIALMELLSERAAFPLMLVPFATSIVLVMGSPEIEAARSDKSSMSAIATAPPPAPAMTAVMRRMAESDSRKARHASCCRPQGGFVRQKQRTAGRPSAPQA